MFPPLYVVGIFITKEYIMELNRFKQLLESTMGNVKPLITEQTVSNIPPLSNLPQEIQSDMDNMFDGIVVNDVIKLSGKTAGQIFSIKPKLKIGNLMSIYCFMDTSVYPPKLNITDVKEGTKCFVCRSNGSDLNDESNFVIYTNTSGSEVLKQFTQETFKLRNVKSETKDLKIKYLYDNYVKLKEFEPFKSNPKNIIFYTEKGKEQIQLNFKDISGKDRDMIITESGRENDGGTLYVYLGLYEINGDKYSLNKNIQVNGQYPLNTIVSFQANNLIPGKDGLQN